MTYQAPKIEKIIPAKDFERKAELGVGGSVN